MSTLIETLIDQFGDDAIRILSRQLGAEGSATSSALESAIPVIISALARNTEKEKGAEALNSAIERDHDGSILDDLPGYLSVQQQRGGATKISNIADAARRDNGSGILGHIFGNNLDNVEDLITQVSGLDMKSAGALLQKIAPVVMGMVGRKKREENLDADGLSDFLKKESEAGAKKAPSGVKRILNNFLDADKDGDIMDDVADMAMKFLGSYFTRRR
ncbi:MAG: DUF937 domain-containing protein [Chitinophagales bacterium]